MAVIHKTDRCFDALYRCPSCNDCYCVHTYSDDNYIWTCKDGTTLSLKWHATAHHRGIF